MSEPDLKEIGLNLPAMIWQTWQTMVKLALERSDGVVAFELKLASAWVKYDPAKITEETIIKNIQKLTKYNNVTVKSDSLQNNWLS